MGDVVELEIVRLGAQGDGIASTAHGDVYVPKALPGERVVAEIEGTRARVSAIVRASEDRIVPECPHFGTCGGCAAQHMGPQLYQAWKRGMVERAFAHRGLEATIDAIVAVPPGRRRRATFTAVRRARGVELGFHEEGSHALVDITRCPVLLPVIEQALPQLRAIADALTGSTGDNVRLAVAACRDGLDVAITERPAAPSAIARTRIAEITREAAIVRVMDGANIVVQKSVPHVVFGGADVALPPAAFIQATAEAEAAIGDIISAATRKAKRVADLFCGLGTFTFGLARRARVLAMDGDGVAVTALAAAAKGTPGIKAIETRVRDLIREPLSRTELKEFDAVVLDPPRVGAKAQAEALARSQVPVVCAVSCNPATLARDCRILVDGGYAIERVVPIDQFVWSPHVEAITVLRRPR